MKIQALLLAFLCSCASTPTSEVSAPKRKPLWISEPAFKCPKEMKCFAQEAQTCNAADAEVKKAAIGYFSSHVKGNTRYSVDSHNSDHYEQLVEEAKMDVEVSVDGDLQGLEIFERFKDQKEKTCFSYGGFNQEKMSEFLQEKINHLDEELRLAQIYNRRSSIPKMILDFEKRARFNSYYQLVNNNKPLTEKVTWRDIQNIRNTKKEVNSLFINSEKGFPAQIKKFIEAELALSGLELVVKKQKGYRLDIKFDPSEEYLNIDGFKKYTFLLDIEAFGPQNLSLGKILIKKVSNGRSDLDAYFRVNQEILSDLQYQISALNIK